LHWPVALTRVALALIVAGAVAVGVVSGGSSTDPRTPAALPGLPPPFLGTAVVGNGELTAAVDAYGDVVDLRPEPAGRALIDNPIARQTAGTVAAETGIVPLVSVAGRPALPLWRADSVSQRYLPGSNVVRTTARFGAVRVTVMAAVDNRRLALVARTVGERGAASVAVHAEGASCKSATQRRALALICMASSVPLSRALLAGQPAGIALAIRRGDSPLVAAAEATIGRQVSADRAWIARARPLHEAPPWARAMYRRSLLTLRALSGRNGAVAAGARDGWSYVWPRDAGAAALAFAAAGYEAEARRVARFLTGLELDAAARFHGNETPVPGRAAQGDAAGWVAVAARAAGLAAPAPLRSGTDPSHDGSWRDRADYQEGDPGEYLANAIASGVSSETIAPELGTPTGLAHQSGDRADLDSAAAWAVEPFSQPALHPAVRRTLLALAARGTRFGIVPSSGWEGVDPWTAPTAWSAWALAALADGESRAGSPASAWRDRRAALGLLAALRRATTPAGALPERVDARTGIPRSTTPLAWSHAFAILALRQLWP
jgi:hypothetical protein